MDIVCALFIVAVMACRMLYGISRLFVFERPLSLDDLRLLCVEPSVEQQVVPVKLNREGGYRDCSEWRGP